MEKYEHYEQSIPKPESPEPPTYIYYAYSKGDAKTFESLSDAKKFSSNTERVQTNVEAIKEQKQKMQAWRAAVYSAWKGALRVENKSADDLGIYDVCLATGYDMFESYAANYLDEFADKVTELCDFAVEMYRKGAAER